MGQRQQVGKYHYAPKSVSMKYMNFNTLNFKKVVLKVNCMFDPEVIVCQTLQQSVMDSKAWGGTGVIKNRKWTWTNL